MVRLFADSDHRAHSLDALTIFNNVDADASAGPNRPLITGPVTRLSHFTDIFLLKPLKTAALGLFSPHQFAISEALVILTKGLSVIGVTGLARFLSHLGDIVMKDQ